MARRKKLKVPSLAEALELIRDWHRGGDEEAYEAMGADWENDEIEPSGFARWVLENTKGE